MFNLFKKNKVREGKQNNSGETSKAAVSTNEKKKNSPLAAFSGAWAKLNKMDRKQAYTWGAVAVVGLIALFTLGSAISASDEENFNAYESRGYDLANMPFSTDEAEQYLLATKYPDMKEKKAGGLYTEEEKEARQAEDAEKAQAEEAGAASSRDTGYRSGRYYGGGAGKGGATAVGQLGNANIKGATGSGLSGTFGASGDFSNFRSQDKGRDKFDPQQGRKGNAREALFQTRAGSRAAAGLKNDKLVNAKKAMMGGNIAGSKAFMDDSGGVNLSELKGLELDSDAPLSTDLSGLNDSLKDANKDAAQDAAEAEENEWWQDLLIDMAKQAATSLLNWGMTSAQNAVAAGKAERLAEQEQWNKEMSAMPEHVVLSGETNDIGTINSALEADAGAMKKQGLTKTSSQGGGYDITYTPKGGDSVTIASYDESGKLRTNQKGQLVTSTGDDVTSLNDTKVSISKETARKATEWNYSKADPKGYNAAMKRIDAAGKQAYAQRLGTSTSGVSTGNGLTTQVIGGTTVQGTLSKDGLTFIGQDGTTHTRTDKSKDFSQ